MTEQEAIKSLRLDGGIEINGKLDRVTKFLEGLDIAISAIEEI